MPLDRLPEGVRFEEGAGGLATLTIQNDAATAEIYVHGAHLVAWTPRGQKPVLWVSPLSPFAPGKPIRGGVPICFPWFGGRATDGAAPMHGLARLSSWRPVSAERTDASTTIVLALTSSEVPPHGLHWSARYHVTVGAALTMALEVESIGETPLTFEEALHTYYAVSDAREVSVSGLQGTEYLDKPAAFARMRQKETDVRFGAEVDRVYLATQAECIIDDPAWKRRIRVSKEHSSTTVVWNPGPVRGAAMPEVKDGWTGFVCVETCNVAAHAVTLAPGARHTMTAHVAVEA